jgi:hypothetical protein
MHVLRQTGNDTGWSLARSRTGPHEIVLLAAVQNGNSFKSVESPCSCTSQCRPSSGTSNHVSTYKQCELFGRR